MTSEQIAQAIAAKMVAKLEWQLNAATAGVYYSAFDPIFQELRYASDEDECDAIDRERTARMIAGIDKAVPVGLVEALRFYTNPEIYRPHPHGPAFDRRDQSYIAIAALKNAGVEV